MQAQVGASWGLVMDVIDLKRKYDLLGGRNYQAFIEAWHDEKMPYIICGLQSLAETVEFTEETYHVAKAYLNESATYLENVFGMYLLNAFYNCQHLKKEVKVLVTLDEWNRYLELKDKFVENGDDKAAFLFCVMRIENAFVASASNRSHGLEKNFRKYFNVLKSYYKYSTYNYKNAQELVESSLVAELDKLRCDATVLREKLRNPSSSAFSGELTNFKSALQEVIYETKVADVCSQYAIQNSVESSSEDEENVDDIGVRRQQIKKSSFVTQRHSPRHRRDGSARSYAQSSSQESEPEVNTSDSDYSPSKNTTKKKKGKKGKRGRPRKLSNEFD